MESPISISAIEKVPLNEKHYLLDYIEGFPKKVQFLLKNNINNPYLDPSIFKGKERSLNKYSTLIKYFNPKNIKDISLPSGSYYQCEYCDIHFQINNIKIYPNDIIIKLKYLTNMPVYNNTTMIDMENCILDILNKKEYKSELIEDVNQFIMDVILPYKYKAKDFYEYLEILDFFGDSNNTHIYENIHSAIMSIIKSKNRSYADAHDFAVFIYLYLLKIGIKDINNYSNRFFMYVSSFDNQKGLETNSNFFNNSKEILNSLIISNDSISDSINYISQSNKYSNIFKIDNLENSYLLDGKNNIEIDNMIFLSKDKEYIDIDKSIPSKIRMISKEFIIKYLDNNSELSDISFFLTDNDIGHIRFNENTKICTSYDNNTKSIKYICKYDDEIYVLFRSYKDLSCIYGISIDQNIEKRKIMTIQKSLSYNYKYEPTI